MRVREMMANAAEWLADGFPAEAEYSRTDESIRRALIRELRSQGLWDPQRCDVMVRNGAVQIAGVGASAQQKIATRAVAVSIPGVRSFKDGRPYWVPKGACN